MFKIALFGRGKLASAICQLAIESGFQITPLEEADVLIDATAQEAVLKNIETAMEFEKPIIIATTGWYHQLEEAKKLVQAHEGFCLYSPNFSILMQTLLRILPDFSINGFDKRIHETHHIQKKDSPSGTALALSESLGGVEITSFREKEVLGEHEIFIESPFESLSICHKCRDRRLFAAGILDLLPKIQGKKGFYSLKDFLC